MVFFKNLVIGKKIVVVFGVIVLINLVFGGYFYNFFYIIKSDVFNLIDDILFLMMLVNGIKYNMFFVCRV